jgi:hypothetical protein
MTALAMPKAFETELATYNRKLNELLADVGRFVLIKDEDVVGIYDSYKDAVEAGYAQFKLAPFFVKQIAPVENIHFFARDLHAHHHG